MICPKEYWSGVLARVQAKEREELLACLKAPYLKIIRSINAMVVGAECKCGMC